MRAIKVRNVEIGETARICVPLTGGEIPDLVREAEVAVSTGAEIVEWRADCFEPSGRAADIREYLEEALDALRRAVGETPLLFTFRTFEEGSERRISAKDYEAINRQVISCGKADLIDLEYARDPGHIKGLLSAAKEAGIFVILSHHDFEKTPSENEMLDTFMKMQSLGADITKLAVMPFSCEDVFRLLSVAKKMKTSFADRPFIAIAMGEEGKISRLFADSIGSALTYGAGENSSAPGQIRADLLKEALEKSRSRDLPPVIFLIGFMGSGKSTVGQHLSLLLGYEFVDMDALIEKREKMTIARIFEMEGEPYFRELESKVLKELLKGNKIVVACGGGVVGNSCTGETNKALLGKEKPVVFLRDAIESMFGRIAHDRSRPLAASELRSLEEQFDRLARLYQERLPHYEEAATLIVDGTGKDPYQIAMDILKQI